MSKKVKGSETTKRENIKWTEEMDSLFIDAVLEQQSRGFRVDGTFTSAAYKNMLVICGLAFGFVVTKDHLKNRIKTLKNNFNTCHEMFKNLSGISWNSDTKMFEAEDQVWDDLIKANPSMRKWSTPITDYEKLQGLFSKDRATGSMSSTCNGFMNIWRKEAKDQDDVEPIAQWETSPKDVDESNPVNHPSPHPDKVAFDEGTSIKSGSKRKQPKFEEVAISMFENNTDKLDDIVNCMKHSNQSMDSFLTCLCGDTEMNDNSKLNIMEELKKCGVPHHRLANAYVVLGSNKEEAKLFFTTLEELRLEVLNALMDASSS